MKETKQEHHHLDDQGIIFLWGPYHGPIPPRLSAGKSSTPISGTMSNRFSF